VAALRRLDAPEWRVRRDGRILVVPARDLLPCGIVALEAGCPVGIVGQSRLPG